MIFCERDHNITMILYQKHPLFLLAHEINWPVFEASFKVYYSAKMGASSKPHKAYGIAAYFKTVT